VRAFRIIVAPYELGRLREGVGRGPERLLGAGAEEALASRNAEVRSEVVVIGPSFGRSGKGDVDASFALIREIAKRVRAAVDDGAFPVVLSGSCFVAVGVMAGLSEPAPAAVWLDAHADFNSPEKRGKGSSARCPTHNRCRSVVWCSLEPGTSIRTRSCVWRHRRSLTCGPRNCVPPRR